MTRRLIPVVLALTFAASAFAQKDLKSRADTATGGEKAKLCVEYTEEAAKAADKAFQDGKDEESSAHLKEVVQYAKAAAEASMQSHKREKETEIGLRKVLKRLMEVKNARPVDQQGEVQETINAVLVAHDSLLDSMFKKTH